MLDAADGLAEAPAQPQPRRRRLTPRLPPEYDGLPEDVRLAAWEAKMAEIRAEMATRPAAQPAARSISNVLGLLRADPDHADHSDDDLPDDDPVDEYPGDDDLGGDRDYDDPVSTAPGERGQFIGSTDDDPDDSDPGADGQVATPAQPQSRPKKEHRISCPAVLVAAAGGDLPALLLCQAWFHFRMPAETAKRDAQRKAAKKAATAAKKEGHKAAKEMDEPFEDWLAIEGSSELMKHWEDEFADEAALDQPDDETDPQQPLAPWICHRRDACQQLWLTDSRADKMKLWRALAKLLKLGYLRELLADEICPQQYGQIRPRERIAVAAGPQLLELTADRKKLLRRQLAFASAVKEYGINAALVGCWLQYIWPKNPRLVSKTPAETPGFYHPTIRQTLDSIARMTGLTRDQVRTALSSLVTQNMIARNGDRITLLWERFPLDPPQQHSPATP